jgi:hypothetical protein
MIARVLATIASTSCQVFATYSWLAIGLLLVWWSGGYNHLLLHRADGTGALTLTSLTAMHQPVQSNASRELTVVWLERYRHLGVLIEQQPEAPFAWVWNVRQRILAYLLHRYGSQVSARDLMSIPATDRLYDETAPAITSRLERAPGVETARHADVPLRSASNFRPKLAELRDLNEPRYAALAEQRRLMIEELAKRK